MTHGPGICVLFEPAARPVARLAGATAVVIDAIRATTTIVAALAAGAREVVPCRTEADVKAEAARRPAGSVVTAGERGGRRLDGLDLNNSPSVMTAERLSGRTLLLTTTNGTQAIHDALSAETVLIAAMANRRAVARRAAALARPVVFVPAGTVGEVSCEDVLVAGAVIEALAAEPGGGAFSLDDSARVALAAWRGAAGRLAEALRETRGGRAIVRLGLEADLDACALADSTDVVPVAQGNPPVIRAG